MISIDEPHHSVDPIAVAADPNQIIEVECGKCLEVIQATRAHVEACIERRRKISQAAAYYKCWRCYQ